MSTYRRPPKPRIYPTRKSARRAGERLLRRGLNAGEVSRAVGVTPQTAANWRKALGLPAPPRRPHPQRERALALMQKGKNNREIASALGIRVELVRRWRPMAAIPQPGPDRALGERLLREGKSRREVMLLTGASQGTVTQWRKALGLSQRVHPARERAMALLRQGLSCAAVHRATGVTIVTISLWRAELRGTASRRSAPSRSDPRRALVDAMLHAGKNNAEIAAAVGVSRPTVARWRRELGLLYRHPRSAPTERL